METIVVSNEYGDEIELEVKRNHIYCPQCEAELEDPSHLCMNEDGELEEYSLSDEDHNELLGITRREFKWPKSVKRTKTE